MALKQRMTQLGCFTALLALLWGEYAARADVGRPNILWLSAEDISPHLHCYGDPHAITPRLDQLAQEGVRYTHAFTTAGVCAPCRSGIITGMYQTTLGTHHMRCQARLPEAIRPFPTYLREVGYYTSNNSKEDYQFETPKNVWHDSSSTAHWRNRGRRDQPFFAVFNFSGCHESGIASTEKYQRVTALLSAANRQDPSELTTLPPYYPDTPRVREDWKRNYELITALDAWAGELIDQLQADGLYDDTIVMFWSDHGVGLPRAKRWLYDSGVRVPLIVRIPEKFRSAAQANPGSVDDRLISSIDFGPTVMNLAGLAQPEHMQGRAFLGPNLGPPREYVFGARDRMDERYDVIRMVRDRRFKYLRNYEPLKTYYQYMNTPEKGVTMSELRRLHRDGQLPPDAERLFASQKPVEELYDTRNDPHEINNLANDPHYAAELTRLRTAHLQWAAETCDLGLIAEPILVDLQRSLGHRYGALRQEGGQQLASRLLRTAVAASAGPEATPLLTAALSDPEAAVRYWAATGLGNQDSVEESALDKLTEMLADESRTVQIAAARALCRHARAESGLPVLAAALDDGAQWERLQAAIVLDEIDELARPVLPTMRAALAPREELYARGKYVVRVINRALNELEGGSRRVR